MEKDTFIKALEAEGYDVFEEEVVMVRLDPEKHDPAEFRRFVREVIGWEASYGIKFTIRPKEWDEEEEPGTGSGSAKRVRSKAGSSSGKRAKKADAPRPPARDEFPDKKARRKAKEPAEEQLPGQLSFDDIWGTAT